MLEHLREWFASLQNLEKRIVKVKAATVTRTALLNEVRSVVDAYFRSARPALLAGGVSVGDMKPIDDSLQSLLSATHSRVSTALYKSILRRLKGQVRALEQRMLATIGAGQAKRIGDVVDLEIISTLKTLVPSAALAYRAGCARSCCVGKALVARTGN